ncbi:MAG: [Fe-Fe] hydrogenase large subunit C-terminal domain-containing protein [Synergistaceae bacterium]|nr:[Fe-Fe] hydrogenase large subunit C-terminal domain-containing protein [Synergistaceae bacterium]
MFHSVKISKEACQGCVNCIRVCPTEAIRVVDGEISIIGELCIDCGECLRSCHRQALGIEEDDWNRIKESSRVTLIPDPVFFTQFSHYMNPALLEEVLTSLDFNVLIDELEEAFDLSAAATAQLLARTAPQSLPMISSYCPSVLRLIQSRFPELISRVTPILSPISLAADLWHMRTNSSAPITLLAPCSSKITMVREPQGRERSPIDSVVTVRRVARSIMASNVSTGSGEGRKERNNRWIEWARRGGETKHIKAFSEKKLTILSVSGMRNTIDVLQELELGRLRSVDFIECRTCDTGCVGGIGTADSRFLASLRLNNIKTDWEIKPKDLRRVEELYAMDFWSISKEYMPRPRLPLSDNVAEAMVKLQQMKEIYSGLPHIDCGSCGRPSCQAMAEEIVRGHGSVTDCIFKLREGIASLANKIVVLSESQPQTLKRKGGAN